MSTPNDGTTAEGTPDGTDSATTPDQKGSPEQDPIALARKRQAGAEAARQEAERQRNEALAELEKYRAAERSQADKDLADTAKLQEKLAAAEKRAAEAEAKAEGRILDVKYPKARAELPDVTDEVRLARFEALLSDDDTSTEPPPPQNPNESNRTASADATAKAPKEETSDDIKARLATMGMPDGWM